MWQSLTDIVVRMRRVQGGEFPSGVGLREAAAGLAINAYGPDAAFGSPALVNCAALALSMPRLISHRVSAGAARVVAETDLHTLPGEPPRLLRAAWILEARRPEEPLFGDTASLGGYSLEDAVYLVGVGYPDGVRVARWTPRWQEQDLEASVARDDSPLIDDVDAHHEWAREAARFAVVLGLLLEAEGSPVLADEEQSPAGARRRARAGSGPRGDWAVRRVYLSRLTPARQRASSGPGEPADLTDRRPEVVPVRGHIKRQPYGPGRSERRWIYVEGYEARRWVSPRPLRVEVGE